MGMDPKFKAYKTGMVTVLERYPCGRGNGQRRGAVYYLCKCDCGKEFIVSGDELSRHPYSCGCTPKPIVEGGRSNEWALGFKDGTALCMIKPTRRVYASSKTGVSGVVWDKRRKKYHVSITLCGKNHFLGYFADKDEAIKARVAGEQKYFDPLLSNQ